MSNTKKAPMITSISDSCCGCGACAARCPGSCISMEFDSRGFAYPVVTESACIVCGACDRVCPVLSVPDRDDCEFVLWAKALDDDLLDRSSSGGVFGLLAKDFIMRQGVVAGAAWTKGCHELRHVLVDSEDDLKLLMRSKYVQSSIGREVYEGIKNALRDGRPALFCGTACQVAGMRSYLKELACSNLFLGVDVICHGVPSPKLWRKWLDYIETRDAGKVYEVNFRSKTTGWLSYSVMYEYVTEKDGAARFSAAKFSDDWYMRAFLKNASLRGSCLNCPFKRRCGSDVTLGDYWGIQQCHPDVPIKGGVSAVLENTAEGVEAVGRVVSSLASGPSSLEKVVASNSALVGSVMPYSDRDAFLRAVADGVSISDMMKRWSFNPPFKQKIVSKAKGAIKRLLGKHSRV